MFGVRPRSLMVVVFALVALVVMSGSAAAAPATCGNGQVIEGTTVSGNLSVGPGACTLRNITVTGAVSVQPGAELYVELEATVGSLSATQAAVVDVEANHVLGAVHILESGFVRLEGFWAEGNVSVRKSTGNVTVGVGAGVRDQTGKITITENVGGTVVAANNSTAYLTITKNVGSGLIEEENDVNPGNVLIADNNEARYELGYRDLIVGSLAILRNQASEYIKLNGEEADLFGPLRCFGNSPAPIGVAPPEVEHKTGQCKGL